MEKKSGVNLRVSRGGGVKPRVDIDGSGEEGFTWVCYPNIVSFPRLPNEAATALWDLGFSSIIVPFYGNPHFVREGLRLRPVYQDRWLQAYSLAPREQWCLSARSLVWSRVRL